MSYSLPLVILGSVLAILPLWTWIFHYLEGLASRGNPAYFNWHPFLMSIGIFLFIAPSTMMFTNKLLNKESNKKIHAVLNVLSLGVFIAGVCIVYDFHYIIDAPHFYTLHSWLGLLFLFVLGLQLVFGILAYLLHLIPSNIKAAALPIHRFVGRYSVLLAICAALTGLMEKQGFVKCTDPLNVWCAEKRFATFTGVMFALFLGIFHICGYVQPKTRVGRSSEASYRHF